MVMWVPIRLGSPLKLNHQLVIDWIYTLSCVKHFLYIKCCIYYIYIILYIYSYWIFWRFFFPTPGSVQDMICWFHLQHHPISPLFFTYKKRPRNGFWRIAGHHDDIVDFAWAPNSQFYASCSKARNLIENRKFLVVRDDAWMSQEVSKWGILGF